MYLSELIQSLYLADDLRIRQSVIAGESEHLSRCSGKIADRGADNQENQDHNHTSCGSLGISGGIKHLQAFLVSVKREL